MMYSGVAAGHLRRARGAPSGKGTISERIPGEFSRRDELRGVSIRATLARGFCLPRLWQPTRGIAEEPGAHLRMPRLRSSDIDHGWYSDAPGQIAADSVVLGRASDGNPLERHVG